MLSQNIKTGYPKAPPNVRLIPTRHTPPEAHGIQAASINFLPYARHYHRLGFNVVPIRRGTKRPDLLTWEQWKTERQTAADIEAMPWHRAGGIGVVCGPVSGNLTALDFDKQANETALHQFLQQTGVELAYGWLDRTPSGGFHVLVRCDLDGVSRLDRPGLDGQWNENGTVDTHQPHVEVRYTGCLIMVPPSFHPDHPGKQYEFINGKPGDLSTLDPDKLLEAYDTITLPPVPTTPEPERAAYPPVDLPTEYRDLYERWCLEVERAALAAWTIAPPNGKNLSRKNFSSPLREDRNPSAQWSYTAHGFKDYATGEFYSTKQVAELLGLPPWEDYKAQNAPAAEEPHHRLSKGKNTLEETIQPVELPDFQAHQTVTMRYISDLPVEDALKQRVVLVKSPVGTGKTELVKRVIADLDQQGTANVLVVTHRQALATNIAARLGLESYLTIPDTMLKQAHRLVITYNSLHKIETGRQWDLVVIDEIEQFHQHLFGDTFRGGEAYQAHQTLTSVLQHADHFIGLDAHLTDISAQWAHKITNTPPYIIQNTYRHDWGELIQHASESATIAAALYAAQEERGPVIIPTSSRKRSEIIYRLVCDTIGPDGVLLVNGENSTSSEVQRFVDHINEDLPKRRVLICTPSFGTGLDVTAPVYGVFGVMLNRPLVATDMIQMLGRFRNAEQRHVYVQPLHQNEPRDAADLYGDALDADFETRQQADFAQHGIGAIPAAQRDLLRLAAQLHAAADQQKTDLVSQFVAYATAEGFTLTYRNGQHAQTHAAIRATAKTLADERKARVLTAAPVDRVTFDLHQQNGTVTPQIIAGHERWKIENTVGLDSTSPIYDDLYRPAKRAALRRLTDLFTARETLKARDRSEAADQVLLIKRGHYTTTRDLIFEGLALVFGPDISAANAELTEADIVAWLSPWLANHLPQIQRQLDCRDDLSSDPMFVLRRLLAAIGLKLYRRQIRQNGGRLMVYSIDLETRDRWVGYARARLAHLARIEALSTNPEKEEPFRVCRQNENAVAPRPPVSVDLLEICKDIVRGRPGPALQAAW